MKQNEDYIAIYSRKSKFTGKGESIGNQVELCKEYIISHFGNDAVNRIKVFEDEGFSGGDLNRPDFKRMIKEAKQHKFKAIIVYRLDRISRNVSDFSGLIEELSYLDISFISIKEQFDTSSPMGRAMMYIASVFSQLERETIAERIRDNMHELAKTGRWLGGTTPTGYASESIKSISVDGKSKKACKLKLIPEEAEIIKTIYELFFEKNSLTKTESELMRRRIVTKNGRYFTRFSIKSILQNPVYAIADTDIYNYFKDNDADLFSDTKDFDGQHGIMAYNRTKQEKGKATIQLPTSEWIVSVGKHQGIIPGNVWVKVQELLEQNKSKSYRRPPKSEALLSGILYCSCGNKMYPKLSKRKTADGDTIYTYVCRMKERSQRNICNQKNATGNTLDMAVIEQLKSLLDNKSIFYNQLRQSRKFYTGNRTQYEEQITSLKKEKAEIENKINVLIDSLVTIGNSSAKNNITKRIEKYNTDCDSLEARIRELTGLVSYHTVSDSEFDVLTQMLLAFKNNVDEMSVEKKRTAIRTFVRKIVWDGVNAHIVLFGIPDDDIEYPEIVAPPKENNETTSYIDVNCSNTEDDRLGKTNPLSASKTHWGEDSKRDSYVFQKPEENSAGYINERAD